MNKHSDIHLKTRAIKAILSGQTIESISKAFRFNRSTIHRWLQQYKRHKNFKILEPKRRSGRPKKLTTKVFKILFKVIFSPASNFGFETDFWTCRRLIQYISAKYGILISQPTMWRLLREADLTYQKPERRYKEADPKVQQEWIQTILPQIKRTAKRLNAILYFEDEATIQLSPVLGKTWAPKGDTPVQKVTGNRGSIAAISAISNDGRLIFNLMRGRFRSPQIIQFLSQMLQHHQHRHLVVVMDKAKPHISKMTESFIKSQKRLRVYYFPSRSPEMNPDEKIWNHLKHQELKSHQATNLCELEKLTHKKLFNMSKKSSLLKGLFLRACIAKLLN